MKDRTVSEMGYHLGQAADDAFTIRVRGEMPDELQQLGVIVESLCELVDQAIKRAEKAAG